ncbi:MAG TPA: SIMPL domain-containing protein [Actinoplanes sp.]|nr:SIMPL domain-containing protein [Actinoplanes sp.]
MIAAIAAGEVIMEIATARRTPALLAVLVVAVLVVMFLVLAWLLGSNGSRGVAVASQPTTGDRARDGVLVSGTGFVKGRPDVLTVQMSVETQGPTVEKALNLANQAQARLRDAFTKGGVSEDDLQTSNLSIYPQYAKDGRRISGYQVSEHLSVKLRDLARAGALIGRAADAGGDATRINGLSFDIEDDSALLAQARRKAFDDAKAKAELYAQTSGRGLGRVVSINESVSAPAPMEPALADSAAAAFRKVPIQPGEQRLSVTATVEWAFS